MVIKLFVNLIISGLLYTTIPGCMFMRMAMDRHHTEIVSTKVSTESQDYAQQAFGWMVKEIVSDLFAQELSLSTLAVFDIRAKTNEIDGEMIRQKLISEIVASDRFKVVSRDRLSELFNEQGLTLSGVIDSEYAVEVGKLIGVDGFIDGYATLENNQFDMSLNLIRTSNGVIIWSKSVSRMIQ